MNYFPIVYFNDFWLLRDKLVPLNETVKNVTLTLDVYRLATWKFTLYNQMEESFSMQVCWQGHNVNFKITSQIKYEWRKFWLKNALGMLASTCLTQAGVQDQEDEAGIFSGIRIPIRVPYQCCA